MANERLDMTDIDDVALHEFLAYLDLVRFFNDLIRKWNVGAEKFNAPELEFSEEARDTTLEFLEYAQPHESYVVCTIWLKVFQEFQKTQQAVQAAKEEFGFDEETEQVILEAVKAFLETFPLIAYDVKVVD